MTTTWTATPQDVERVIAAVLPHASEEDRYLPTINNVRIEIDGDRFVAVATDRYSLGVCRDSLTDWAADAEPVEPVATSLALDDIKRLFAFLRPQRKDKATWELTHATLTVKLGDDTALTIRTVDAENFPNWRKLITDLAQRTAEPGERMAFTPRIVDHFQRTAKALGESTATWKFTSPLKPVIVHIGDRFLGILMPCRIPDDAPELDLGLFGINESKAVAA